MAVVTARDDRTQRLAEIKQATWLHGDRRMAAGEVKWLIAEVERLAAALTEANTEIEALAEDWDDNAAGYLRHIDALAADNASLRAAVDSANTALRAAIPVMESFADFWEEPRDNADIRAALAQCRRAVGIYNESEQK